MSDYQNLRCFTLPYTVQYNILKSPRSQTYKLFTCYRLYLGFCACWFIPEKNHMFELNYVSKGVKMKYTCSKCVEPSIFDIGTGSVTKDVASEGLQVVSPKCCKSNLGYVGHEIKGWLVINNHI